MNKSIYFATACVVLALAALFMARQGTLIDFRAANHSLRQQIDSQSGPERSVPRMEITPDAPDALGADERNELLRLRGQVPQLRSAVADASNRIAALARIEARTAAAGVQVSGGVTTASASIEAFTRSEPYRNANALAKAVQTYLRQHAGQIPGDLAAVQVPGNAALADGTIQRFELVRTGKIEEDPLVTPYLLIAHEKEPWQMPDGRWVRLYIQANGGLTIIGPSPNRPAVDDSDFVRNTEKWGRERALKTSQVPPQPPTQSPPQ